MDHIAVTILRSVTTLEWFLAFSSSSVVLYIIIRKTPQEHRNFAILLLAISGTQNFFSTVGWSVVNRLVGISPSGAVIFVMYGICGFFGPKTCFVLDQTTVPFSNYIMTLFPFSMMYRLFAFYNRSPKKRYLVLILFIMTLPWFYLTAYMMEQYVSAEELALPQEMVSEFYGYPYYGVRIKDSWQATWLYLVSSYSPIFYFLLTVIFRTILLHKIKKYHNSLSQKSKALHRSLAQMLLVQSLVPLIAVLSVVSVNIILNSVTVHPLFGCLAFVLVSLTPIIDSFSILFFVPHYRTMVKRWLFKEYNIPTIQSVSSQTRRTGQLLR